ncbi:hypothetical protein BT96DRAFT_976733 [Gymnopus androsaceus JB14]|uniref:HMG box domain-containing protein n=1 Tax=Gymnopus androsaceus JB14 TaxID=1447944 RepID=A0A6A4HH49_9AGAR|nr:hypothetical protein BT96DRAFT_976733 [Gymnopus androsaceus JB14]
MPPIFGWTPSTESTEELSSALGPASPLSTSSYEDDTHTSLSFDQPARKGDPNWAPRPRNAFMIFRCQYCKEHARGPGGSKRGQDVDTTMSKRASVAWHALSEDEQNYYRRLADKEKRDHARAHPGYRYRPKPRSSSRKSRSKAVSRASKSADSRLESYERRTDHNSSLPSALPVEITPKRLKRRSTSVPPLPPLFLTPDERLGMRRTKSDMQSIKASMSSPSLSSTSYGFVFPETEYSNHVSPLQFGSPTPTSSSFPVSGYHTPPLGTIPSLTGWNGEMMDVPMERTSSSSSTLSMHSSTPSWASHPSEMNYQMTQASYLPDARPRAAGMYDGVFWNHSQEGMMSSMSSRYQPNVDNAALHNYNLGLSNQVVSPDDFMLFDVPIDEQRIFEGFVHY